MNMNTPETAVVPTTFGGGGSCHRIAEHIRKGRSVLPPPPQMTPHVLKHLARVAQVRVGACSIPAVPRHVDKVKLGGGGGALPAVQRHLIGRVTMGASASPVQKHLDKQR